MVCLFEMVLIQASSANAFRFGGFEFISALVMACVAIGCVV